MAIAFVQSLLQGSSKTSGTSLVLSGSKTITTGNTIFVAQASDDSAGTYSVTDNLGNTYSLVGSQSNAGAVAVRLWRSDVTTGGTLTTITLSHPTTTARAAIAVEFSGCGATQSPVGTDTETSSNRSYAYPGGVVNTTAQTIGNLWIGAYGAEAPNTTTLTASAPTGSSMPTVAQGTTGGGSTSNVTCGLSYIISTTTTVDSLSANTATGTNTAAVGAAVIPAAAGAVPLLWKPRLGPNYRR